MRSGIKILNDVPGSGEVVERHHTLAEVTVMGERVM